MKLNNILEEIEGLKMTIEYSFANNLELTSKDKQEKKIAIRNKVKEVNTNLIEFNYNLDKLLNDINQDFNFELFIEELKNTSTFDEINPRVQLEKANKILKYVEEKKERDRLENERIDKENEKYKKEKLLKEQELLRVKLINRKKIEEETNKKYLSTIGRDIVKNMYYNGPENIVILNSLLKRGYDFSNSIYPIIRLIERGRTIGFIKFLIQNGLKLNYNDIVVLKKKRFFNSPDFLKAVSDAKQIDNSIVNKILLVNE
jgi:hypothetical protein